MTNTPELLFRVSKQVGTKLGFFVDSKGFDLNKIFQEIRVRQNWDLYEAYMDYVCVDECSSIYDVALKMRGEEFKDSFIWFKKMRLNKFQLLQKALA